MRVTIKEIEIDIALAELNELPRTIRRKMLGQIAADEEEEAKGLQSPHTEEIMEQRKECKKHNWTPEQREAAAERMRNLQASRKASKEATDE